MMTSLLYSQEINGVSAHTCHRARNPTAENMPRFPGNAETEEHEDNAQDENEDDGLFASEALSDSEEDKSPEQVLVTGRRFKETLREEKPPRAQVGNSRKRQPGEVASDTVARQPSAEAFILLEWLDSFFLSHCERQPADGKYHLPNNFTKKEVYDHYRTDMVQVPVQALKFHRKQQAEERAAAGRRRWKALDSPKDCAYIQIDGMDQKKTALPHFSKQPKSVDGAALVGMHLVGAMIFHGKLHTQPKLFRTLNDITQNQQYKFKIASALEVRVWCKQFSTDNTWEPPAGVKNILHIDGSRAILASEQVPLKSYAEIKRQTRRVQNIGPLIGRQEGEAVLHVQAIRHDIQTHCYLFFDDEQKDWWNHWFVQQEEIGRNISNNRRERLVGDMCWFWPVPPERDEHAVDEPVAVTTTEEFRRRIFGQRRPIYSGPRRPAPGSAAADRAAHIGELTEIQEKSFLAVLADDETSF
ncbi:hypothetical protein R1sor_026616 [Riccia sorocarpa]|uniref:Uncharacterized protein n=1 Tax=Riccia sorocarpa TaxID=122646 RepID=A0ABD3GBW8_9MARC